MPRGDLGEARVSIIGDSSQLRRTLSSTRGMVASWGDSVKSILTGALTFTGVIMGIRSIVQLIDEELSAVARLNAVISSTGAAAGFTVDQLQRMASSLQAVTTYGDEAIMEAQALLLTFTSIGHDIFPSALKAVLDVSAALGQDLKSSAIQVGKALQDPAMGIMALRRIGVNFTHAQQQMIKGWVEHGEVARAQQFILAELQREFGGMSEAMRGTLGGAVKALKNDIGDLVQAILGLGGSGEIIADLSLALSAGFAAITQSLSAVGSSAAAAKDEFSQLSSVLEIVTSVGGGFWVVAVTIYGILKAVAGSVVDLVQWLGRLGQLMFSLMKLDFSGVKEAFAGMDKGGWDIINRFTKLREEISSAIDDVVKFGVASRDTLKSVTSQANVLGKSIQNIPRETVEVGKTIKKQNRDIWDEIKPAFDEIYRTIQLRLEAMEALESHWEDVVRGWSGIVGMISSTISRVVTDTKLKFRDLINTIVQSLAQAVVEALAFAAILTAILSALGIPAGPKPFLSFFLGRLGFPATGVGRIPVLSAGRAQGGVPINIQPNFQLMLDGRVISGAIIIETARRRRYGL